MIKRFAITLLCASVAFGAYAQDTLSVNQKAKLISYLRHPGALSGFAPFPSPNPGKQDFVFSFDSSDVKQVDESDSTAEIYGNLLDVFWLYAAKDSASYYDSARVFILGSQDSLLLHCGSGQPEVKLSQTTIDQRIQMVRELICMPSIVGLLPGENKDDFVFDFALYVDKSPLAPDMEGCIKYAKSLCVIITDFIMQSNYTMYPKLVIRLIGKENTTIETMVYVLEKDQKKKK